MLDQPAIAQGPDGDQERLREGICGGPGQGANAGLRCGAPRAPGDRTQAGGIGAPPRPAARALSRSAARALPRPDDESGCQPETAGTSAVYASRARGGDSARRVGGIEVTARNTAISWLHGVAPES